MDVSFLKRRLEVAWPQPSPNPGATTGRFRRGFQIRTQLDHSHGRRLAPRTTWWLAMATSSSFQRQLARRVKLLRENRGDPENGSAWQRMSCRKLNAQIEVLRDRLILALAARDPPNRAA